MSSSSQTAVWLLGRGCSDACGLKWTVPSWYKILPRQRQIACIKRSIVREMSKIPPGTGPYKELLELLAKRTCIEWNHQFVTTNWDYLFQREIGNLQLEVKPKWLLGSGVLHLNGSAEDWGDPSRRSKFLLEADAVCQKTWSLEANKAFNTIINQKMIVVAGMSFRCPTDGGFLDALKNVSDDFPIGEVKWIVINRNLVELELIKSLLKNKFPHSFVIPVNEGFGEWVTNGCLHLKDQGVIQ